MSDFEKTATDLCIAFSKRHNLEFENIYIEYLGPSIIIKKQKNLDFDLQLYLVADDEFSIAYEGLHTYIFPFEQKMHWISEILDGIVTGDCRLTNYYQFGSLKKSVLEHLKDGVWEHAYTAGHGLLLPLFHRQIDIIRNGYEVEIFN